jgi:response regulator RpfG family c-di-GMP phosphodiesterase
MTKTVNYTPEMEARASEVFNAATNDAERKAAVRALAVEFAKPTRSVIAKLSRMGVYVRPAKVDKTGAKVVSKDKLADAIAERVPMTEADATSMAKANKTALKAVLAAIEARDEDENEDETGEDAS